MIIEFKTEKERREFDLELDADPERGPVSHGTSALAALLGGFKVPRLPETE